MNFIYNGNDNKANPFYWAGLISIGNPNPIDIKQEKENGTLYLIMVGIILFIVGIMSVVVIKKKKFR